MGWIKYFWKKKMMKKFMVLLKQMNNGTKMTNRKIPVFGDSDTAWYCLNVIENEYLELDKPSGTLMNKFDDFNTMLADALKFSLDN